MKARARRLLHVAQVFPLAADGGMLGEAEAALVDTLAALPEDWTLLRGRRIGEAEAAVVLIHPAIGVALIDPGVEPPEDAAAALRARLQQERFPVFFPGEMPIVAVAVAPEELELAGERLEAGFAAVPALSVEDRDWADAVVELLLQPGDVAMTPVAAFGGAMGAEAPPIPEPRREAPEPMPARQSFADEPRQFEPEWRLRAEPPIGYRPRRARRPGRIAAAGVALVAVIGLAIAAWSLGGDGGEPPVAQALRQAEIELPLAKPAASPAPAPATVPAQNQAKAAPPPPPPAPMTMMSARQLAAPPPAAPHATAVPPLPEATAKAAPPPVAPPADAAREAQAKPAPAVAPRPEEAARKPVEGTPQREAARKPAEPKSRREAARKAAEQKRREAKVQKVEPRPRREANAVNGDSEKLMRRELNPAPNSSQDAPPLDAADLPPLPPGSDNPPAAVPPPPPAAPAAAAAAAIGPPMRLVRDAAEPSPSGSSLPSAPPGAAAAGRECRPYTSSTTLSGRAVAVQGIACRDGDGQWRLVSEVPQ